MRIAVCEDEKVYSDMLRGAVSDYFAGRGIRTEISVFTDGAPLTAEYEKGGRYELIFLDIQLENSDGMNIASALRGYDSSAALIFVTAMEERAAEGYAVSAFDYIVKSSLKSKLPAVLDRYMNSRGNTFLTVQTADGTELIPAADIICAESDGRGSAVRTVRGIIKTVMPIGKISLMLPEDRFIEIHKSVYVSTEKIKRIGSDTVEMCSGESLPLSRRRRRQVLSAVMQSVKGSGV